MGNAGWWVLSVAIFLVYGAVLLAMLTGVLRAVHERYLPPWIVGLGATVGAGCLHEAIDAPFGEFWGGIVAIVLGIAAGAVYGLSRRRRQAVPEL
ncbi:MAG: hypothetical protein ACRDTZ_03470 [Pseudonocardiaceae bacterium]